MRSKRSRTLKTWLGVSLAVAMTMTGGALFGERANSAWADSSAPSSSSSPSPAPLVTPGPVVADSSTPATAPAATPAPAAAAPAPPSDLILPSANVHFKGFIDTYAQYNPTDASYTNFRAYDFGANSFNVNMAQLKFWRPDDDGIGFVLRTDFGPGAMASGQNFTPGFFGVEGTTSGNTATMPWSLFWL